VTDVLDGQRVESELPPEQIQLRTGRRLEVHDQKPFGGRDRSPGSGEVDRPDVASPGGNPKDAGRASFGRFRPIGPGGFSRSDLWRHAPEGIKW
jgi:hypothetical protein